MIYISVVEGKEQLFVMDADGKNQKQITRETYNHEDPGLVPGREEDRLRLGQGRPRGHLPHESRRDSGSSHSPVRSARVIHPSWSPDGTKLAYCTDDDLEPPNKNASDIEVIDLRTRQVTKLITGGVNTYPVWSPDGKSIAFRRILGEMNSEVFVAHADGSEQKNLTNHPGLRWLAGVVAGREADRLRLEPELELPDLRDERRRHRGAEGGQHRGQGDRSQVEPGRKAGSTFRSAATWTTATTARSSSPRAPRSAETGPAATAGAGRKGRPDLPAERRLPSPP